MKIYTYPKSRSIRVTWTAELLGLEYKCIFFDVMNKNENNPSITMKVPAFVDGNLVLFESSAICTYLSEKYGSNLLSPIDIDEKAIVNQWLAFIISELESPLWTILKHSMFLPESKKVVDIIPIAKEDYLSSIEVLSSALDGNTYIANNKFSIADIFLFQTTQWALNLGFKAPQNVINHYDNLKSSSAYLKAVAKENEAMKGGADS
ncbi:glutathione S-transferase family protein [Providencia heimbachae]|uniref:Glutathione S-transferase n=1 Tax=Providencia heimbachae ATCC 35613 TaxID=1354272 RepID=A0A1B7K1M8_9GAMM|nr:glutathione S-transferase family protein [Providencia heimbachae]OAT54048.1 glutathione S-transferase [Providencia heimbachae ATCC 35613]QCJ70584.1 glutathione S-transferase family protein [Providencia heimbachae]SQH13701.1 Glutathione S-transferase GST-6.0 [Providencia heimbachae]